MKAILSSLILIASLHAEETLSSLLNSYKYESELSKITKKEESAVIDIYTRHDLEHMQAKTFDDILKIIPGFYLTRTSNNLASLQKPTLSTAQLTSIRLYINDHDMSSSSFGSAFLIWGELPIEYIDHIEVYKGASSIEFGNETASMIIKLYTKTAQREDGGKVRLLADNLGSANLDTYVASTVDDFSYFTYANVNNIRREEYENIYEDNTYALKSDRSGYNLYANLQYKEWILELGSYEKNSDSFLGIGTHRTPTGGDLNADHDYMHLSKTFQNSLKLQLSYDSASYDRSYVDPNGIKIANAPTTINDYNINFHDEIFSIVLEEKLRFEKHSLFFGGFYKNKKFTQKGSYFDTAHSYDYASKISNALDLYSLYAEYSYDYSKETRLLASIKGDFFYYDKAIPSNSEVSGKVGVISHINDFQLKAFFSNSYTPTAFYQLYNPDNTPYKTNPNLDNMHLILATASVKYIKNQNEVKVLIAENRIKDKIVYDRSLSYGYTNSIKENIYQYIELGYTYLFDLDNKFVVDLFYGKNDADIELSPNTSAIVQLFSKYKKLDIYNEITYKSAYTSYDIYLKASADYTLAVKYHYTKDLSIGLRGENLFNSAYTQAYKNLDFTIPVSDRKVWINLEYLF